MPPHKKISAPYEDRLEMVKIAIQNNKRFEASDIERKKGGISYTIETLKILKKSYPKDDLYLIVGADEWKNFDKWKAPLEIKKITHIIVLPRNGAKKEPSKKVHFPPLPLISISATQIRKRVKEGKSIRYMVPEGVAYYIEKNRLYK